MRILLTLTLTFVSLGFTAAAARADWPTSSPGVPAYTVPGPAVTAGSSPCECCPRPGLLARLRDRLRGRSCSSCPTPSCCPPRPGLLERIRNRLAERRAGCTPSCR
jgi:hypothetical protein